MIRLCGRNLVSGFNVCCLSVAICKGNVVGVVVLL